MLLPNLTQKTSTGLDSAAGSFAINYASINTADATPSNGVTVFANTAGSISGITVKKIGFVQQKVLSPAKTATTENPSYQERTVGIKNIDESFNKTLPPTSKIIIASNATSLNLASKNTITFKGQLNSGPDQVNDSQSIVSSAIQQLNSKPVLSKGLQSTISLTTSNSIVKNNAIKSGGNISLAGTGNFLSAPGNIQTQLGAAPAIIPPTSKNFAAVVPPKLSTLATTPVQNTPTAPAVTGSGLNFSVIALPVALIGGAALASAANSASKSLNSKANTAVSNALTAANNAKAKIKSAAEGVAAGIGAQVTLKVAVPTISTSLSSLNHYIINNVPFLGPAINWVESKISALTTGIQQSLGLSGVWQTSALNQYIIAPIGHFISAVIIQPIQSLINSIVGAFTTTTVPLLINGIGFA